MASQLNSLARGFERSDIVCLHRVLHMLPGCLPGRRRVSWTCSSPGSAALRHDGDAMANGLEGRFDSGGEGGLNKNKSRLLRLAASHSGELPPTKSDARRRWT